MTKGKDVKTYLEELEKTRAERTDQVKEGLEIYIGLWKRALERGVVSDADSVDSALEKIEDAGGLYKAAGESESLP